MIIDANMYNGKCSCGKKHNMITKLCVIEPDCLKKINYYLKEYNLSGTCAVIYDENTYKATANAHPDADIEIILPPKNLHADNHGVALASEQIPKNCDFLIAVGSGTVHDITRYCAHKMGIPFVSCPTAASVDGFCSSVAAMTWDGFKKTFEAVAPEIVIADLDIISKAPAFLTNSGFGDMIGKFIALADWKISHILTNEYFCEKIYNMTLEATKTVIESTKLIKEGNINAYEKLIYGLLMSGLAMQMLGNSRCASGAEHHISHFVEMEPEAFGEKSDALHGEKVGVGTLIACGEYHRIRNDKNISWNDYESACDKYIEDMFGQRLSASVIAENKEDCATGITAENIEKNIDKIWHIIDEVPTFDELIEKYTLLGVKTTLADIGVNEDKLDEILEYSPLVRNRVTLMRLRRMIR